VSYFEPPQPDYDKYSTKELLSVPSVLLLLAILILVGWFVVTGIPVDRGMEFTGGTELRVTVDDSVDDPREQIEGAFDQEPDSIARVSGTGSYIVQFPEGTLTPDEIENTIESTEGLEISELSQVTASLGDDAQLTAIYGILSAFVLMSLFVIALFRSIIPAVVIILSAVSNILIGLAAMNLVGIQLSFGTVGALLMLIGYSVDSDILLNTHVLRTRSDDFISNVHRSMQTGITMTLTSLSAMVVMFIVATVFGIGLLADMGFLLAIGLTADLVNTYMMNVSILRWYVNRGEKK
jgi:preprotein translocase subunit SecF